MNLYELFIIKWEKINRNVTIQDSNYIMAVFSAKLRKLRLCKINWIGGKGLGKRICPKKG